MWNRLRTALSIVVLALILAACESLVVEERTDYEALQEATDAYLAYERGDCKTASRLSDPDQLAGWEPGELRYSTLLLHGFCDELNGDTTAARGIYDQLVQEAPGSFAARDARERSRILRINESDPSHAAWIRDARQRAMQAREAAPREPLERSQAKYPPIARSSGIEGYAVIEFGVTPQGKTSDPVVIESKPPLVFDGVAVRAVRSWKFSGDNSAGSNDFQVIRLVFMNDDPAPRKMEEASGDQAADAAEDAVDAELTEEAP